MESSIKNAYSKFSNSEKISCNKKLSSKIRYFPHQVYVKEYFDAIRNKEILPQRGILIYHGLGSGKTITSIISSRIQKDDKIDGIIVLAPASLKENYKNELKKVVKADNEIKKYIIISYNTVKVIKDLQNINLNNKIIIIDEAHNLFSMISSGSKIGSSMYKLFSSAKNTFFMLLSGTPVINSPYELCLMYNIIRPGVFENNKKVITKDQFIQHYIADKSNMDKFSHLIIGLTSYFPGITDISVYPSSKEYTIMLSMSQFQKNNYDKYDSIEKANENEIKRKNIQYNMGDDNANINDIWNLKKINMKNKIVYVKDASLYKVYTRQICDFAVINKNELKNIRDLDLKYNLAQYSPKYNKMLNLIKNSPGPVLIYSNFKDIGVDLVSRVLDINKISNIKWTGSQSQKERNSNLLKFNNSDNKFGEKIKCILITSAGAEGLSLKNIRQVHILEPHWNINRQQQVIGRAMRICSHQELPLKDRNISIYKYYCNYDNDTLSTDLFIKKFAEVKYELVKEFLKLGIISSFDCKVNKTNQYYKNCLI